MCVQGSTLKRLAQFTKLQIPILGSCELQGVALALSMSGNRFRGNNNSALPIYNSSPERSSNSSKLRTRAASRYANLKQQSARATAIATQFPAFDLCFVLLAIFLVCIASRSTSVITAAITADKPVASLVQAAANTAAAATAAVTTAAVADSVTADNVKAAGAAAAAAAPADKAAPVHPPIAPPVAAATAVTAAAPDAVIASNSTAAAAGAAASSVDTHRTTAAAAADAVKREAPIAEPAAVQTAVRNTVLPVAPVAAVAQVPVPVAAPVAAAAAAAAAADEPVVAPVAAAAAAVDAVVTVTGTRDSNADNYADGNWTPAVQTAAEKSEGESMEPAVDCVAQQAANCCRCWARFTAVTGSQCRVLQLAAAALTAHMRTAHPPFLSTTALRVCLPVVTRLAASRALSVKASMQRAWTAYRTYAWGADEVRHFTSHCVCTVLPQSKASANNWGGMAVTLVDSLDTLWLMDLKKEFYEARDWAATHLDFNKSSTVNVFETTIRVLGGLLSAYDLSKDKVSRIQQ
eukprot:12529-Heterococcus_DN1.PRE.2